MKYKIISLILIVFTAISHVCAKEITPNFTIHNRLFSISLPKEVQSYYSKEIKKDSIGIYHKESKKAGFGGFAFGIKAYKNPADHAMLIGGRKIGELTDKKGDLYDIVFVQPTDVQFDYTKGECKEYTLLYNLGENVTISGYGKNTYYKNKGMKGADLYQDVLKKHVTAIKEKWDSSRLENENMSYMYNVLAQRNKNVLNKIGYAYYDVNGDGIDELLIGEIANGAWKGVIYDIYTMINRKPTHVISGGNRNRYFICDDCFICNEYSSGANESGQRIYILVENSTELYHQVSFKYDGYANPKKPWFLTYGADEKWENVSEKFYKERKAIFDKYVRFNYIPLSTIK